MTRTHVTVAVLALFAVHSALGAQGKANRLIAAELPLRGYNECVLRTEPNGFGGTLVRLLAGGLEVGVQPLAGGFSGASVQVGSSPLLLVSTTDPDSTSAHGVLGRLSLLSVVPGLGPGSVTGLSLIDTGEYPGCDPGAAWIIEEKGVVAVVDMSRWCLMEGPMAGLALPGSSQLVDVATASDWGSADAVVMSLPIGSSALSSSWFCPLEPNLVRTVNGAGVHVSVEGHEEIRPIGRPLINAMAAWRFAQGVHSGVGFEILSEDAQTVFHAGVTAGSGQDTVVPAISGLYSQRFARLKVVGSPGARLLNVQVQAGEPLSGGPVEIGSILPLAYRNVGQQAWPWVRMRVDSGPAAVFQLLSWFNPATQAPPIVWLNAQVAVLDGSAPLFSARGWGVDGNDVWGSFCEPIDIPDDRAAEGLCMLTQYLVLRNDVWYGSDIAGAYIEPAPLLGLQPMSQAATSGLMIGGGALGLQSQANALALPWQAGPVLSLQEAMSSLSRSTGQ